MTCGPKPVPTKSRWASSLTCCVAPQTGSCCLRRAARLRKSLAGRVRKLVIVIRAHNCGETVSRTVATGLAGVTGLTIAGGGHCIAVSTTMFAPLCREIAVTVVVFTVGVAAWRAAGPWLVSDHKAAHIIKVWGIGLCSRRSSW